MKKELVCLIIIAAVLRVSFLLVVSPQFPGIDAHEYYDISKDFQVHEARAAQMGYNHWYERTPLYVLWLHITGRDTYYQIFLSLLGVYLMYRMNRRAGWLWCFAPESLIRSCQYSKESVMIPLVIIAIYFFRNRPLLLYAMTLIIIMCFSSFGAVLEYNKGLSAGFMNNVWNVFKPMGSPLFTYSKPLDAAYGLLYLVFVVIFARNAKWCSAEVALMLSLVIVYGSIYGAPRLREPFIPFLYLWVTLKGRANGR